MDAIGAVGACWRYPVKSLQGHEAGHLDLGERGVIGDRRWGLLDTASDHLLSAKRMARLLDGVGHDDRIELPDGTVVALDDPAVDETLSQWLDHPVHLSRAGGDETHSYQMTFDPPDDSAPMFEIPTPPGSFVDLADVHLLTTATLHGCREARPELDWDVRRFRPNLVLDVDGDVFVEQDWVGRLVHIGEAVLVIDQPTVRCAMPLRAQPAHAGHAALARTPDLYDAMRELNTVAPNHLGVYASVRRGATVRVGDQVVLGEHALPPTA